MRGLYLLHLHLSFLFRSFAFNSKSPLQLALSLASLRHELCLASHHQRVGRRAPKQEYSRECFERNLVLQPQNEEDALNYSLGGGAKS